MRKRTLILGALMLTLALFLPLPSAAAAKATWHADADDSSSRLDIRRAGLLVRRGHLVTVNIQTFERINLRRNGQLWDLLDAWGGPRWDYGFHIHYDSGSAGIFCDWRDRKGQVNPVIGWSVYDRAATCRFDARHIRIDKPVRWRVFSTGLEPRSLPKPRPSDMLDRVPDGGTWWFPGVEILLDP
jgi:hypothetical protein